jgi:hypothetical protein
MVCNNLDTNKEIGQLLLIFLTTEDRCLKIVTEVRPFALFMSATGIAAVSSEDLSLNQLDFELAF